MKSLSQSLKACINDKDLYHTLLKCYLTYGISLWGGSLKVKLLPLFKAQKKVMRVIFGDKAKYLDKFKTCARVQPLNEQILTT